MFRVLDFPKITLGEIDIDLSSKIIAEGPSKWILQGNFRAQVSRVIKNNVDLAFTNRF